MYINLGSQKIHYYDQGEGETVVLLHGFMESVFMWENLAERLSHNFRVISIDLPGHGNSSTLNDDLNIDRIAKIIQQLLQELNLLNVNIVGHSLGGYITLSFVELYPSMVNSYTLLHSKAGDDPAEVKLRRKLGREMLQKHPQFVIKESITNLFRIDTRENFSKEIKAMVKEGQKSQPQGYEDAQVVMMNRPDRKNQLGNDIPKLYIAGKYDPVIPYDLSQKEIALLKNGEHAILMHSGHMGFIEERKRCEEIIETFLVNNTKHQ